MILHSFPADPGADVEMQKAQRQLLRVIAASHLTAVFFVADLVSSNTPMAAAAAAVAAAPALPAPTSASSSPPTSPTASASAASPTAAASSAPADPAEKNEAAAPAKDHVSFDDEESEAEKEAKIDKIADCLHAQAVYMRVWALVGHGSGLF